METPSNASESSFTAKKAKNRHKKGKPGGPTTPPATPNAAQAEPPTQPKKNDWSSEPPAERLETANAALRASVARFQSLGCLLYTENFNGHAVVMLSGIQFQKPGTNDPTLSLTGVATVKPVLTMPVSSIVRPRAP